MCTERHLADLISFTARSPTSAHSFPRLADRPVVALPRTYSPGAGFAFADKLRQSPAGLTDRVPSATYEQRFAITTPSTQFKSVIPQYLAAHGAPRAHLPTFGELGLDPVIEAADRCFDVRSRADYLSVGNISSMRLADNPWREVLGLAGSIGESLVLAAGCEIEVEYHRRARLCGDLAQGMIIGQRFFSEAEGQKVLGVGHRLGNLVLRAVAIDRTIRVGLADDDAFLRWRDAHEPFSDERDTWIALNRDWARRLARLVKESPHGSIRRLVSAVVTLQRSTEWRNLDHSRGQRFHRWRAESSVVSGVDRTSGNIRELVSNGVVIGQAVGTDRTRYATGDGLEESEAQIARSALLRVARATDEMLTALYLALEPLSEGHLLGGANGISSRIGYRWTPDKCGCCT
jgi:hypothetical protein